MDIKDRLYHLSIQSVPHSGICADALNEITALETALKAAEDRAKDAWGKLAEKQKELEKQYEYAIENAEIKAEAIRFADDKITALETALKAAKEQRAEDIARVCRIYKM